MSVKRWWACDLGHRNEIPDGRERPYHARCSTCPDLPTVAYWIEPLEAAES